MMNIKYWLHDERWIAATTLKDNRAYEQNNMALHVCEHPDSIIENRKKLADILQVDVEDFVCSNQTHSANFYKVTNKDKGRGAFSHGSAIPNVDAMYTFESNIVLCCFTADCVPVIFYNESSGVVGVIHSGWKGTVEEITPKLFHHLINVEKCNPSEFHVHLGSCLSQKKFEVDEDVQTLFEQLGYVDECMYYYAPTNKY